MAEAKLGDDQIKARIAALPGWSVAGGGATITKTFAFPDFVRSIQFVNRLAEAAEEAQHHPDIDIRYSKVTIALSTHDAGGLTAADFALAGAAEEAASTARGVA